MKTRKNWFAFAGAAALLSVSLAGCGATSAAAGISSYSSRVAALSKPHRGGTVTIAQVGDAITLDPMLTTDEYSAPVEQLLYNSLVKLGPKGQIEPDLASSWNISSNGLVYTFHLRSGVTFHHGGTMTAQDVVYSFNRIMSPKLASPWASFFSSIKSVSALNNSTVQVTLSTPNSPFLTVVASFFVVMNPSFVNANKGNLQRVEDGTGPFILQKWIPNQSITLVRNPHYFIKGEPYLNKVVFQIIPSSTSEIAAFQSGRVQFAEFINPADYAKLDTMARAHTIVAQKEISTDYHMLGFNTKWGPFKNPKVRLALSYAINRQQMLNQVGFGQGAVTGLITEALKNWAIPTKDYPSYKTNIAKAKKLLKEAGYPHGFSFKIMAPSSFPVDESNAVVIAQQLKAIGVKATVVPTEWGTYLNNWVKRSFESFTGENGDWTDPDLAMYAALHTGGSTNAFQFSNPEVDKLLQQGRTELSYKQRYQTYAKLQKLAVSQAPMLYLFASYNTFALSPSLHGYTYVAASPFAGLQSAWLGKSK